MLPWRFIPIFLLILFFNLSFDLVELRATPTSLGPTSEQEAQILWRDGKEAAQEKRFSEAVHLLQRLVDRYPGHSHYLEAHYWLGRSLSASGQFSKSVAPLKYYVSAPGQPLETAQAKIALGEALVHLKKFHEAYLISTELDEMAKRYSLPADLLAERLILKCTTLLALKREPEALQTIESGEWSGEWSASGTNPISPLVRAKGYEIRLRLQLHTCARLPSPLGSVGDPNESQSRNQMERRGLCLLETLLHFREVVKTQEQPQIEAATSQLKNAYQAYANACIHPPIPRDTQKVHRTPLEKKRYQEELALILKQDCKKKASIAIEQLQSWKSGLSPASAAPFQKTIHVLESSFSRF